MARSGVGDACAYKLTFKGPITTAVDNIHKYFFILFQRRLDISYQFSARQRIHMKHQALFSVKIIVKKIKCHLQQFLFGAIRVNMWVSFT